MKFFFISTDHFEDRIWFKNDGDFQVAMNYVALASVLANVNVIAFVLMSNHVHFLLQSSEEEALFFINHFKKVYGMYYERTYDVKEPFRRNRIDIQEVTKYNEALEKCIAYILMNPVAANICAHPAEYPWGTGSAFFNQTKVKGVKVGSLSERKRNHLLRSRIAAKADMILGEDGYILPRSYVPVAFVESLFRTPSRMSFFLKYSSKARARLEKEAAPSFRDQSILISSQDLCRSLFRKSTPAELTPAERTEWIKQLKRRFCADVSQLARITGFSTEDIARMLDDYR